MATRFATLQTMIFKCTHFYHSTIAISIDKVLKLVILWIFLCTLSSSYCWYRAVGYHSTQFSFPCNPQNVTRLLSGLYLFSLTECNYGHHSSNHSWHHARELSVQYCIFTMFSELCGESFRNTTN